MCTLVYVCLSVIEAPAGAVQVPVCMRVCAQGSHICVCSWPGDGAYLFSIYLMHCVCVHVHTQAYAHRTELKEREVLDRLLD